MSNSSSKRIPFWLVLCGAALLVSLFLAQQVRSLYAHFDPNKTRWLSLRYKGALDFISADGFDPRKFVPVFGASEIEPGFNAVMARQELKGQGIDLTPLNFGFRKVNNPVAEQFYFRIEDAIRKTGHKFPVVYVKLAPERLTTKSEVYQSAFELDILGELLKFPEAIYKANDAYELNRMVNMWINKILFDGVSASDLADWIFYVISTRQVGTAERHRRLWGEDRLHSHPPWDPSKLGFFDWNKGEQASLVNEMMSEVSKVLASHIYSNERKWGVISLPISPELIDQFAQQYFQLRRISEDVVVFYFPENPRVREMGQSQDKIALIMDMISKKINQPILNLENYVLFQEEDYFDTYHLNDQGIDKLTKALVKHMQINQKSF